MFGVELLEGEAGGRLWESLGWDLGVFPGDCGCSQGTGERKETNPSPKTGHDRALPRWAKIG